MTILVTGGAGFIGAYVVRALQAAGHEVTILDNWSEFLYPVAFKRDRVSALLPDFPREKIIDGDVTNAALLRKLLTDTSFDLVLHLAALTNPGKSMAEPKEYWRVNVGGTQTLLAALDRAGISRVIFAGSSSVYNDKVVPFREDGPPLRPRSPYGQTKAEAEKALAAWQVQRPGRSVTILRFFSVYGPWGRPDMAPMIFAQKVLAGEAIEVTTEERQRDFTYIDDTLAGLLAAVERPFSFEIINLGRGEPTTLRRFIAALEAAAQREAHIVPRATPRGEMQITYADIAKARRLLNYQPHISVEAGTRQLVEWLRRYQPRAT